MAQDPSQGPARWRPDATLLDALALAAVVVDLDGHVVYANTAAQRLFAPDDAQSQRLVGADARERLLGEPPGAGAFDSILRLVVESGSWGGELSLVVAGRPSAMSTTWSAALQNGRPVGALVVVEHPPLGGARSQLSAAAGQHARRLDRLAEVISELLTAESVEAVAKVVSDHLTEAAGAAIGSLALLVDEETLSLVAIRGGPEGAATRWASFAVSSENPVAECARTRTPLLLVGREEIARRFPDHEVPVAGERSIFCLPLLAGSRILGVVGLSFPGRWSADQAETLFLRLMADTCALTLDRIDAQAAAADREAKLAFLAETSARLASDLDYEATLTAVAEAAIPWFADWCTVALSDDGLLRTIAVAHRQPQHEQLIQQLQERYPPRPEDGSYEVLRTGESLLIPEVTDALLRTSARDDQHYEMMARLGLRSGLSCALKVGDRTFGVITWISGGAGRRFTAADQAFGETLAQRAGVAIDNAQLHSQVRDVALRLQRAVLPDELPELPGWTTAVRYLPAGRTDVGGDFYDVIPLADGRLGVFVGDVMGRGVQAASVMAQMRSAIRTLVAVDPAPASVLAGMDRVFETLRLEHLVTMVYALASPGLDRLEVINAGHPSPLVLRADGSVETVDPGATLLLGAGTGTRTVRSIDFPVGDALLLYTDGLVERRGEDPDAGMTRLIDAVGQSTRGETESWLAPLVDQIRDPTRDDDVAALLVRRDAPAAASVGDPQQRPDGLPGGMDAGLDGAERHL